MPGTIVKHVDQVYALLITHQMREVMRNQVRVAEVIERLSNETGMCEHCVADIMHQVGSQQPDLKLSQLISITRQILRVIAAAEGNEDH